MKRLLLVSHFAPNRHTPAGLVVTPLCRFLPRGSLAWFGVLRRDVRPELAGELDGIPLEVHDRPSEYAVRPVPGPLGGAVAWSVESIRSTATGRLAGRLAAFAGATRADALWCHLGSPTTLGLTVRVARMLDLPLYTQLDDPPSLTFRELRLDRLTRRRLERAFGDVLRRSEAFAAASEPMAEAYGRRHGVRAVPLMPGLDAGLARPPADGVRRRKTFVIGMAGQLYASEAWGALVEALQGADWSVAGRDVQIRLLGPILHLWTHRRMEIEYLGWRSQAATVSLLAEADLMYCPYLFAPEHRAAAALSFPSKLTTYLATGRPVLFHGPDYAAPARFLREHDAGFLCHSLEPPAILEAVHQLITDEAMYARLAANGRRAFDEYLSLTPMRSRFAEFLGVETAELRPEAEVAQRADEDSRCGC